MTVRRATIVLAVLVFIRALLHAFYLPVFEGPDEPFHLDRALPHQAGAGMLTNGVVTAIRRGPCGPDLAGHFNCPTFAGKGAFNVLTCSTPRDLTASSVVNYEAHQPPLFYLFSRPFGSLPLSTERLLLALRLLSWSFAVVGVALLMRSLQTYEARLGVLGLLLFPGAVEALVRISNDALLFLWTAVVMANRDLSRRAQVIISMAAGPLVKLTAFPVCAATVALSWLRGSRALAIGCAVAALAVLPVQMLRGWAWGGTLELNYQTATINETFAQSAIGFVRSTYTFVKTTFWLGGWSFFRAPYWLVAVFFILILGSFATMRFRVKSREMLSHAVGATVAVAGFTALAVAHRRLFGTWGGLGGWYFWGWFPWLAVAAEEVFVPRVQSRWLIVAWLLLAVIANLLWFRAAAALYGPPW